MKKVIICLLLIFLLAGCVKQRTEHIVEDLNENSNFEYDLLTEITGDVRTSMEDRFSSCPGFGVYTLFDKSIDIDVQQDHIHNHLDEYETTTYDVTAYPDYSDGREYITSIWTTDPEIHIYDLYVGDSYTEEELKEYMTSLGFSLTNNSENIFMYNKERLNMSIFIENNAITKMYVRVDITNRWDIQY